MNSAPVMTLRAARCTCSSCTARSPARDGQLIVEETAGNSAIVDHPRTQHFQNLARATRIEHCVGAGNGDSPWICPLTRSAAIVQSIGVSAFSILRAYVIPLSSCASNRNRIRPNRPSCPRASSQRATINAPKVLQRSRRDRQQFETRRLSGRCPVPPPSRRDASLSVSSHYGALNWRCATPTGKERRMQIKAAEPRGPSASSGSNNP